MVSVEQITFFQRLKESPLQPLFTEIYSNGVGNFSSNTSNASDLALNLLIAVKRDDRQQAERNFSIISKRQPTKESHWIYDNYVLFCVVIAVSKFGFDHVWISDVINLALTGTTDTDKRIRETFKNILSGNLNAKKDFHQISMVYQFLSKDEHYLDENINKIFGELWSKPFPFFNDDFLNLISLKAIEISVVKKNFLNEQDQYNLSSFVPAFDRRANLLAHIISWVIIVVLILLVCYGLLKVNEAEDTFPNFVKPLLFLIGVSGVGVLGIIGWKKGIAKVIRKLINSFFNFKTLNH